MTVGKKLVFLDIDGTLTSMGSSVPPASAQEAIRRAQANGHLVALCSGRNHGMLSPLLRYGFDGVVASAGGYILWDGQVLFDCPMTEAQGRIAAETFAANGVSYALEAREDSFADEVFLERFRHNRLPGESGSSELDRWQGRLEELGVRPISQYRGEPLYKIIFLCPNEACLTEPRRVLEADFNFCVQGTDSRGRVHGELINRKFNKGTAIRRVCEHLDVPLEDTVAFGDSMNDLEMIETAGAGVCMGNGNDELKARADLVCPPVDEDGLYRGFQQCGLI